MPPPVRPATPAEVEPVLAAYAWLFAPPGSRPPLWDADRARGTLTGLVGAQDGVLLVSEHEGAVAGFCTVVLDLRSVRFGQRAWVEDLAVDPAHRSAGHGKALLDAARDWARERGATHLELDSADSRADAHRFYEREGPSWTSRQFGWQL